MTAILSQELAMKIFNAHSEILRANKLLDEINIYLSKSEDNEPTEVLRDAFGRQQHKLELGIPSGHSSRSIISLSPQLGKYIIEAHLSDMEKELKELSLAAALSLGRNSLKDDHFGNYTYGIRNC